MDALTKKQWREMIVAPFLETLARLVEKGEVELLDFTAHQDSDEENSRMEIQIVVREVCHGADVGTAREKWRQRGRIGYRGLVRSSGERASPATRRQAGSGGI